MEPRVSVIIPIYNVERYIAECIESLLRQTFTDFEAICVDSGSSDRSIEIAREVAGDDPRFVFTESGDNGQSVARNRALDIVRGEYLLNLDSDDYYVPDTLERLVKEADASSLDMLYFSAKTFYETDDLSRTNPERQDNRPDIPGVLSGPDMYVQMEKTGAFRPSACMFMFKRSLVEEAGLRFVEGIIHEDLLFTMMIVPLAKKTAFLNETFYMRRMRAGSTMTTARGVRNIHGHLVASMHMEAWLQQHAGEYSAEFCDWYAHRIHHTWMLVAQDVRDLSWEEIDAFRDSLPIGERIALDLHGIEPASSLGEVLDSTTFKVGHAMLALPTYIKDRLANHG